MSESIGVGGAWKNVVGQWVGVGAEWKRIAKKWVGVGGEWKICYSALSVTIDDVSGSDGGFSSSGTVTSSTSPNTTVSYGSGSYTYLWEHVSTSSGSTPQDPSNVANPTWVATVDDGNPSISVWRVTVTDTVYGITATDTNTVTLTWTDIT